MRVANSERPTSTIRQFIQKAQNQRSSSSKVGCQQFALRQQCPGNQRSDSQAENCA